MDHDVDRLALGVVDAGRNHADALRDSRLFEASPEASAAGTHGLGRNPSVRQAGADQDGFQIGSFGHAASQGSAIPMTAKYWFSCKSGVRPSRWQP